MARNVASSWAPGWAGRTQAERIRLYTLASLYAGFWCLLGVTAWRATAAAGGAPGGVAVMGTALVLGVAGAVGMHAALRLHPDEGPLPAGPLALLAGAAVVTELVVLALPVQARFHGAMLVVGSLAFGAGGFRDRRVTWALLALALPAVLLPTGDLGMAGYALFTAVFLIFTVRSSFWLLGVVAELDEARRTQAALAVAEERLRFSRDVHDVLGRRLSTIALQAELAASLAERDDARAPEQALQVRETAHEALREARELAQGYRPLDLAHEVDGAVSLLRSAGIDARADLDRLPERWHEPVARVVRECVTNVLRHSRATCVTMRYADGEVVLRNDGVADVPRQRAGDGGGTGLRSLEEQLAPLGAHVRTERSGDQFVARVRIDAGSGGGS
ncbi:sensor histidine kinase [Nocardioides caldifontis]|uniref:sensor histidine kinase n=1 Tax=Nocardioides caldifontis TaxID=2588938 RepID=UPI0011DF0646|nr:histidine kinase [Nocardioides caldifontis]